MEKNPRRRGTTIARGVPILCAVIFALATSAVQARDMQTDRPNKTETPYTVELHRVQVELGMMDHLISTTQRAMRFGELNVKYGVTNFADIQLLWDAYNVSPTQAHGIGDTGARLKLNLTGNDEGMTAVGIMPFVRFPTGNRAFRDQDLSTGAALMGAIHGPLGHDIETMLLYQTRHPLDAERTSEIAATLSVQHFLRTPKLHVFVEIATDKDVAPGGKWSNSFDTGFLYNISPDLQLDTGVNIGLEAITSSFNPFGGVSFRL